MAKSHESDLKGTTKGGSTSWKGGVGKSSDRGGNAVPTIEAKDRSYSTGYGASGLKGTKDAGSGGPGTVPTRNYHDEPSSPPKPRRVKDGVDQSLDISQPVKP